MAIQSREEVLRAIAEAKNTKQAVKAVQEYVENAPEAANIRAVKSWGGGEADEAPAQSTDNYFQSGAVVNPLRIDVPVLKAAQEAGLKGVNWSSVTTKTNSYSGPISSLLPASLDPQILPAVHEGRLMDFLPVQSISTPVYRQIVHSSSTGAPAPVSEGGLKPTVTMNMTTQDLTVIKVAANWGITHETLSDFGQFLSYSQSEMMRQMSDIENAQILNGDGTAGSMIGFTHTSGVLTHDASADNGTNETAIDSIEKSITALRTGASLAVADTLVLHPATWSAIRRLKDTGGRMLFLPLTSDVSAAEANSIFGLRVVPTTAIAAGKGVMLDTRTRPFGRVYMREGLTIKQGTSATDFVENVTRFVIEERFVLGVDRPASVMVISNLPTS